MTNIEQPLDLDELFNRDNYMLATLDDEIKVDQRCRKLLENFLQYLLNEKNLDPLTAGSHAKGADYFLRDYMIDHCRENIFAINAARVSSFAGNWYIVSTLEPNMEELESLLQGVRHFYAFCAEKELIDPALLPAIVDACSKLTYYTERIEDFHQLKDDGFLDWNSACPIK